ncbi:MAG: hypothetical protein IH957_12945, partial [Chloroflexi bacterium]|nr:hypothetical protein [Chloroflexota bacterium]
MARDNLSPHDAATSTANVVARLQCRAARRDGLPCRAWALPDDPWQRCVFHTRRNHRAQLTIWDRPEKTVPRRAIESNPPESSVDVQHAKERPTWRPRFRLLGLGAAVLALVLLLFRMLGTAAVAESPPVVDGEVDPGEYALSGTISYASTPVANLFFTRDSEHIHIALRMNALGTAVANENVYGSDAYHNLYDTGWRRHTFGQLEQSDAAAFEIFCAGDRDPRDGFLLDYVAFVDGEWVSSTDNDLGTVIFGSGPVESMSSLAYNLNTNAGGWTDGTAQSPPFNPLYPNPDAAYAGWVWEMIYEFSLDASTYSDCADGDILVGMPRYTGLGGPPIGGMHNSPPKPPFEESIIVPPFAPSTPVPPSGATPTDTPVLAPTATPGPTNTPMPPTPDEPPA